MLFTILIVKLYYSYYYDLCNRLVHILAATLHKERNSLVTLQLMSRH